MKSVIIFALCLAVTQGYSIRGREPKLTAVQAGGRIYYGWDADNGQFPHMVYLTPGCGGGLISDTWVLSAAHCYNSLPITAYLGDVDLLSSSLIVRVIQFYNHPRWDGKDYGYDISLLELRRPVTFTDNIQPIRLPRSRDELFEESLAILSGFGQTENGKPSYHLKYIYQTVLSQAECNEVNVVTPENLVCTMGPIDTQTACGGDSGGPLMVKRREGDILIGIVSFTVGGCFGNTPTGYVKPHFFLEWIRNTTGLDV